MLICPVCQRETKELIDIPNPGKQYKQCCTKCHAVALLITDNYPYNKEWFDIRFPMFRSLFRKEEYPFDIMTGYYTDDKAKELLNQIRNELLIELIPVLNIVSALDIVVLLSRLFSDITELLQSPSSIPNILEYAQKLGIPQGNASVEDMYLQASRLRLIVLFAQKLAIQMGSWHSKSDSPDINLIDFLLQYAELLYTICAYQDTLYYKLFNADGIVVVKNQVLVVDPTGLPIHQDQNYEDLKVASFGEIINQKENIGKEKVGAYEREFYNIGLNMDDVLENELGISGTSLLYCYDALSQLSKRYRGTLVFTIFEFRQFLSDVLHVKTEYLNNTVNYLLYRQEGTPMPQDSERFYFAGLFVPVDQYGMIVLNADIIGFARVTHFHDLTYGSHPFVIQNKAVQIKYEKLKRKCLTAPFEQKVASLLRESGWSIGVNLQGGVRVNNKTIFVIPKFVGEIDILARSPQGDQVLVIDCKYLFDYGAVAKEVSNTIERFDSYRKQIHRKTKWVTENFGAVSTYFNLSTKDTAKILPVIVTRNRIANLKPDPDTLIFSYFDFEKWIARSS